jgi:hypothetical protein
MLLHSGSSVVIVLASASSVAAPSFMPVWKPIACPVVLMRFRTTTAAAGTFVRTFTAAELLKSGL